MSRLDALHDERAGGPRRSRRSVISWIAAGAFAACAGVMTLFNLMFLRPRVTTGEASKFRIGRPENFSSGSVVEFPDAKVVVRRSGDRFSAVSLVCTHLGCTVRRTDVGFECPCHGSVYDAAGSVIGGPAPKALSWYRVSLTPSGELEVDKQSVVPAGTHLEVAS
ncbi:MAG: Rieske 2Fe-2S domain-containing protein [Planctomycetes bacterium]|nr:Rieske 2Fe-2S domain-containing protein [Planctomycetota bacterium]